MKKKNFVSLIFGTVGVILFGIGMCMCSLPEWGAFTPGVVIGAAGIVVLLVLLMVRRKMEGKPAVHISGKAVGAVLLSIAGALVLGVGMCMAMIPEWNAFQPGIVVGCIGAAVLAVMLMIRRKMGGRPVLVKPSGKAIGTVVLGATGALVLGIGMCMVMVWSMMVQGILVGLVGILLLLCLIPLVKGIQ